MAHIKIEVVAMDDHGHYGKTYYYCSECQHDCGELKTKCPNCGVEFDEKPQTNLSGYPFGGHDFL